MKSQVSIIVLTYNKFGYLFDCLNSIIIQDYENIQLIISDDGSINFPNDEIEDYIVKNRKDNIKEYNIIRNTHNQGTVKNLNIGLSYAKGDYIIPIAADDVFYDDGVVKKFVEKFEILGEEYLLVTSQVENVDINVDEHISYAINDRQKEIIKQSIDLFYELCKNCFIPSGGTAYKRDFFIKNGKFDERYVLIEDWPTFLKISRNGDKIGFCDLISVKHRSGGVSNSKKITQSYILYHKDLIDVMEMEIVPYISILKKYEKKEVYKLYKDKKAIYKIRFEFKRYSFMGKMRFILYNFCFLPLTLRRLIRRFK